MLLVGLETVTLLCLLRVSHLPIIAEFLYIKVKIAWEKIFWTDRQKHLRATSHEAWIIAISALYTNQVPMHKNTHIYQKHYVYMAYFMRSKYAINGEENFVEDTFSCGRYLV